MKKRTKKSIRSLVLHVGQQLVEDSKARFKVLMCGRRWGKTLYGCAICLMKAANLGHRIWWVAPYLSHTRVAWRLLSLASLFLPNTYRHKNDKIIKFPSGGSIEFKSADKEATLRSDGLDGLVMDEAAFIKESAWTDELRPALVDRKGWVLFFSTPNGKNWYWKLWQACGDKEDWEAFQFTSYDNPHLDPNELDAARESMPEEVFEQEHMAIPLEGSGTVFRNIIPNLYNPSSDDLEAHRGHMLLMSVDWAKHRDWTVVCLGCGDCKEEMIQERFNKIDYTFQRDIIKNLYDKWLPEVVLAEANAMGEPNIEGLWEDGVPVTSWIMTAANKPGLIRGLSTALQRKTWKWLEIKQATFELEAFEQKTNPNTGRSTYSAPSGANDDTVIARALLVYAEANYGHIPVMVT